MFIFNFQSLKFMVFLQNWKKVIVGISTIVVKLSATEEHCGQTGSVRLKQKVMITLKKLPWQLTMKFNSWNQKTD